MHRNNFLICFMVVGLSACIRSYEPEILAADEMKLVVTGLVTDAGSLQKINISITSPFDEPQKNPVDNCHAVISDRDGHSFPMTGVGNGDYTVNIDPAYLVPGSAFKVMILTKDGDEIESDFDVMPKGPEMDSVYYLRKDIEGNQAGVFTKGIQFYVNLRANESDSRYYRWEAIETWEYHTRLPITWYYDGHVHHVVPPDSSLMICWKTLRVPDIFTLPTDNLAQNKYDQFELNFVNNLTTRLSYGYSLLVNQYALSREAFIYWENLRVNSNPQGGLYEKQPLAIKGNLHNLTHPEKQVLGFFEVSSLRSRRIFVHPLPDLPLDYSDGCDYQELRIGLSEIKPQNFPAYLAGDEQIWYPIWYFPECVDCRKFGGTTIKPDFWPQ